MSSLSDQFLPHLRENLILLVREYETLYQGLQTSSDATALYFQCWQFGALGHSQKRLLRLNRIKISQQLTSEQNPVFLAPLFEELADAYLILGDPTGQEKAITPENLEKLLQQDRVVRWLWEMRHLSPPKKKDNRS